jgi:hypothetical protein
VTLNEQEMLPRRARRKEAHEDFPNVPTFVIFMYFATFVVKASDYEPA